MCALRFVSVVFAACVLALAGWVTSAGAAPSGIVIAVVQSAHVDGQTGKKILEAKAPVFDGDHIVTGTIGERRSSSATTPSLSSGRIR